MSPLRRLAERGLLVAAVISLVSSPAHGENPRALLLGGFRDDCTIIRAGQEPARPKAMMSLYAGDKIIQKGGVNEIVIKCSPFTSVKKLDEATLQILCQPPAEKKAVLKELQSFLGFEKDNHQRRTAGTRGIGDQGGDVFIPQPGYWATVMPGEAIEFSWDKAGGKTIVFRDSSGATIFSKALGEKTSIELTPREIAMRPAEIYRWEIEIPGVPEGRETYALKLLEDDMAERVAADLDKLAKGKLGDAEKKLRISAYCQFISDTYPREADLYWRSYQVLKGLDRTGLTAEQNDLAQALRDRCIQHIEEYMATGYR
jgi:hypothetical protein